MNVSLLTKYNNYSYPARSRINPVRQPRAMPVKEGVESALSGLSSMTAAHKGLYISHHPSNYIKRAGYTELNGSWDQFAVSRFIDLLERNTGSTLDADAIMRKYDADGDGLLNPDEQTAMIEGLTKAEFEGEISRSIAESIIEQLKELSEQNNSGRAYDMQRAVRRYERLFLYESMEVPDETAALAV